MFPTLVDCGSKLQNHLEKLYGEGELLDVREVSASHNTNVIASVAFGIEVDSLQNPDNEFRVCGRTLFDPNFWNGLRNMLIFIQPKLMNFLRIRVTDASVEKFIFSVVKENLDYREKNNVTRKDFFQLLIQLRNSGTVQFDDQWDTVINGDESQKTMTLGEMAAQSLTFFAAGFETSSSTLSFCMFELAKDQEIQHRVHQEIDSVLELHDGKITYDSISDMKYLDACVDGKLKFLKRFSF